ncbi:hypothetical protein ACT2TE_003875 [Klebsiella pneumoniae]|nr:hypothetical protein [Klebsiella pneumoniae]HDZ9430458.1 hypothetical protein [Klebsiella pneumoniae]
MTTDITELAQSKSLRKKLNRRLNDAYGFQRTSGGKHTTISLSIDECKSIIAAMGIHLRRRKLEGQPLGVGYRVQAR